MNRKVGEKLDNEILIRSVRRNNKYEHFVTIPAWWLQLEESIYGVEIKRMVLRINEERILMVPISLQKRKQMPPVSVDTEHAT